MAAEKTSSTCEACGHEQPLPTPPAPPAAPQRPPMAVREANPTAGAPRKAASAGTPTAMTEAERSELIQLRAYKRDADARVRAGVAITTHEAEGVVTVDELMKFRESQWNVLIPRWLTPPREYGTGAREMPAPGAAKAAPQTAAEVFIAAFEGDPA